MKNILNKLKNLFLFLIIYILFLYFFQSCINNNKKLTDLTIIEAKENEIELNDFLKFYKEDKLFAAEFIIGSMIGLKTSNSLGIDSLEVLYRILPKNESYGFSDEDLKKAKRFSSILLESNYDAETITSNYLKENLEDAWDIWQNSPWSEKLTKEEFCEYILPYRIGDEPLTSWRKSYREWLLPLKDTLSKITNSVNAARIVSEYIKPCPFNAQLNVPHRSALNLLEAPVGNCREDCDRTTYAMRSLGIPVVTDVMIVSPDNTTPHQWNSVYDTDDKIFRPFDNGLYLPTRDSIHNDRRKKGKVYRQTFSLNLDRLEKYKNIKHPPVSLMNPRLKDVTSEYFGENEAIVETNVKEDVFLGVFGKGDYHPLDIADKKFGKANFHNIEPYVIFFPISTSKSKYKPCGYPFLLKKDGNTHFFKPNTKKEKVILERKYPRGIHTDNRLATLQGLIIQWSTSAMGPWNTIAELNKKPRISYNKIDLGKNIQGGYLRMIKHDGVIAQIAEIIVTNDDKGREKFPLSLYFPENNLDKDSKRKLDNYKKIIDGEELTWWGLKPGDKDLILKIDTEIPIKNIFIVAHNDDNFVLPGQDYELLYFEPSGWKSLGRKVSKDFFIEFEAPENAVLLLKNHTKGNEEQVFIYHDDKQIFNQDLCDKVF